MGRRGPKPKRNGVRKDSKQRRARRARNEARQVISAITEKVMRFPQVKFPLQNCSDFVCYAAACKRLSQGVASWDADWLLSLALCFLVMHSLRTAANVAAFVRAVETKFRNHSPLLLAAHIVNVLRKKQFARSTHWTGLVAVASFQSSQLLQRASSSTSFVVAKSMADLALHKVSPGEVIHQIRQLPHIDLYGFDIYRHWVTVLDVVCKVKLKTNAHRDVVVLASAKAMTKHVGVIYDCVHNASSSTPINDSVLACEVYAFLSSLALVPAMRSAGLDNVDINGLRRLANTLDTQVARRIDTHDEKQEVNLHFAKEVKALKLKHTSVPLKSYAKQFKAPSKSKHH